VFCCGAIMIARQRIQAGLPHAGKTTTLTCEISQFRVVIDGNRRHPTPRHHPRGPPLQGPAGVRLRFR
jgi:hypothetical protein